MAASPSSLVALEPEIPVVQSFKTDHPPPANQPSLSSIPPSSSSSPATADDHFVAENPNFNRPPPPPSDQSFTPSSISTGTFPPSAPSFRPVTPIPAPNPQFTHFLNQNPNFQNPYVQPPGVNPVSFMPQGMATGAGAVTVSVSPLRPSGMYQIPPGRLQPPYPQMPNGFPMPAQQGMIRQPGIYNYPSPYTTMVRPSFPPRPPGTMGILPPLSRPPILAIRGVPPNVPPVVRPVVPIVATTEKPQATVYVGKIASTVENDFMLSLLRLCGSVKSWKRAQDPTDGSLRGFGFCEFDSADGVLRALRLLSKFNVDGQELVLNVNQATREYLESYVEKKAEREKLKETETEGAEKEESASGVEKGEPPPPMEDSKKNKNNLGDKENQDTANFGIVTDEDREADRDALEKLSSMIEERLKDNPLPPPPAQALADVSGKSNSEVTTKSRDGDSDVDIVKSDAAEGKNDDEMTSKNKPTNEYDRSETNSPDRNRRYDRKSRDKDREKREKERELERYERERERERIRRERELEMKIREAERLYKERVKEWESREREKEYQRQHEREREKERERECRREIMDQEDESDDDNTRKRRRRSSAYGEKRKKWQREKEDDLVDRLKEEEEIAEAKRKAIKEKLLQQQQKDEPKVIFSLVSNESEKKMLPEETNLEGKENSVEQAHESDSGNGNHAGDVILRNGSGDESTVASIDASDMRQGSSTPARKLGFGLIGSGKRTAVHSVFHEEDDDRQKEKKMRPLVPIDYSTEEVQSVQSAVSGAPSPNLAAAAEYAKHISNVNTKEERLDAERERNKRSNDRSSERYRDWYDNENHHPRDKNRGKNLERDRDWEHGPDKPKTAENKKLLDAKQLIDMIPKTKEELFSYNINWTVYDKHELHERMRPWIAKKITEFLGEEEPTLVDYIVSGTKSHMVASKMLELLQSILDEEAEMFVLKMWRMLIFEIKKVEIGLSLKPKA